jgi:PPK2 family polyphosphate:nucleotide phosphotransferase
MVDSLYLAEPGKKVRLSKLEMDSTGDFTAKEEAGPLIDVNLEKLRKLQLKLYAQSTQALLIVIQAMDTGGKDGAIRHVFSGVNPQGCQVTSFKRPSELELGHDFLWRIHAVVPRKGMIGIFNRSHYESVLIERVHNLVPKNVWSRRYDHINEFEKLLSDEGTTVIKFFLHISKEEQKRRLEARLEDSRKNWKFDHNDLHERKYWNEYMEAYENALEECSTKSAPWYIVPADHKWFRNWVISGTVVRTMEQMKPKFPDPPDPVEGIEVK